MNGALRWISWQLRQPLSWMAYRTVLGFEAEPDAYDRFEIRVACSTGDEKKWLQLSFEALELLETHHPAKFQRVQKYVRHLVFYNPTHAQSREMAYHCSYRMLGLNIAAFPINKSSHQQAVNLAGAIVCKATEGYLLDILGICSNQPNDRINSIGRYEQDRVLLSLSEKLNIFL